MGYSAAVKAKNNTNKNAPVSPGKMAQVTKASPMGKVVQVKGPKSAGPALHLGKKSTMASVKSSSMSNKLAVVDMPAKGMNGRKPGKNMPVSRSTRANVSRPNSA